MENDRLLKLIEKGDCPHAILFCGGPESDWTRFVRTAAARFLLHSDNTERLKDTPVYMELSEYSIDAARDVLHLLNAEAFEQGRRCVTLLNVHCMSQLVQNVLLKTLEEPPEDTLLLLTGIESGILPTILSRCMIVREKPEPWEVISEKLQEQGVSKDTADLCAKRCDGVYGRAERMTGSEEIRFRREAIRCLEDYCNGTRPLREAAKLCTGTEAEDGEGKKRPRVTAELADSFFDIWLEILSDALRIQTGAGDIRNTDSGTLVKILAESFTMETIQGMINTLFEGKQQLTYRATASMTLDWVLCKLP